jgi:hypothetical protein
MTSAATLLKTSSDYALRLVSAVLARDDAHLAPAHLTKAAAGRMRAGIRAVEAYLRRLILVLALQFEHTLPKNNPVRARYGALPPKTPHKPRANPTRFTVFTGQHDLPDALREGWIDRAPRHSAPIPAAPLIARLRALSTLAKAPEARARRLAWTLARKRPGPILTPDLKRRCVPARYGTEVSAIYDGFHAEIIKASRARPPPIGHIRRPPPRIRCL